MKTLSISDIVKKPSILKEALENETVRIQWREPKPNGKVTMTATVKKDKPRG
jgi:hypothetical protein